MPTAAAESAPSLDVEACYRRYGAKLKELVARHVGDQDLAEEIVQEAFLRVVSFAELFDVTRPEWPWLAKIVRGVCANTLRGRGRAILADAPAEPGSSSADPAERCVEREGEVLWALPARYRNVLLLKHVLGLRYEEIADLQGLRRSGVHALLVRARKALRRAQRELGRAEVVRHRSLAHEHPLPAPATRPRRERAPPPARIFARGFAS